MSIVVLARKNKAKQNISKTGFSINGGRRNIRPIGQSRYINSSACLTNDPLVVKKSSLTNYGMLKSKVTCTNGNCPIIFVEDKEEVNKPKTGEEHIKDKKLKSLCLLDVKTSKQIECSDSKSCDSDKTKHIFKTTDGAIDSSDHLDRIVKKRIECPKVFIYKNGDILYVNVNGLGNNAYGKTLMFEWFKDGTVIPGANGSNFDTAGDVGNYSVTVSYALKACEGDEIKKYKSPILVSN